MSSPDSPLTSLADYAKDIASKPKDLAYRLRSHDSNAGDSHVSL